jgi:hypothetical protein
VSKYKLEHQNDNIIILIISRLEASFSDGFMWNAGRQMKKKKKRKKERNIKRYHDSEKCNKGSESSLGTFLSCGSFLSTFHKRKSASGHIR